MSKKLKVHIKLHGFDKTETGRTKVWSTDGISTYCCSSEACYFIWEKPSKYNDYNPYSGYVAVKDCEILS